MLRTMNFLEGWWDYYRNHSHFHETTAYCIGFSAREYVETYLHIDRWLRPVTAIAPLFRKTTCRTSTLCSQSTTNKIQRFSNLFVSLRRCTCFRRFYFHHQKHKTAHTTPGIYQTVTAACWQMPDALCAVLFSWWWTEKPSETCRTSYRNK